MLHLQPYFFLTTLRLHPSLFRGLKEIIPNLRIFMEERYTDTKYESPEATTKDAGSVLEVSQQCCKFLLSKLICAISSKSHPTVMMFEDLQWADENALDTIQTIIMDKTTRYCLFLCSYRYNDSDPNDHVTAMFDRIQVQGAQLLSIRLGSSEKEAVNSLVSETLVSSNVILTSSPLSFCLSQY